MATTVKNNPTPAPKPWRPQASTPDQGSGGLRLSLFLHFGLLALFLVKSLVFPGDPQPLVPTLRVDIVGLPDALKKDLRSATQSNPIASALKEAEKEAKQINPKPLPKQPPAETVADPHEMVLKPKPAKPQSPAVREHKLKNALARIKALDKLDSDSDDAETAPQLIKGNKVSKGSSLSGDAREGTEASYYEILKEKLQSNWTLPTWIQRQKFSAQVRIFIDAYGRLRNVQFEKPSGNSHFDDAVRRTIQQSQPFAPPPEGVSASLLSNGILIGFPL